jgi:enamine deaminase RidA (YjgF/YER057c/UK114 family)
MDHNEAVRKFEHLMLKGADQAREAAIELEGLLLLLPKEKTQELAHLQIKASLGSLDRVARVVRLGVFMATSGDFFDQPRVADGASDLFRDVFGSDKMAVRLVIGVASLPLGMPVELEVIFEIAE